MKKLVYILFISVLLAACKDTTYVLFGEKMTPDDAKSVKSLLSEYKVLPKGDTLNTKITGKIDAVCQKKGCWMKLNMDDSSQVFVKFKDYGFFMPMNSAGKEVVVNGKAYVSEISVSQLRHYAEDAGKSKEEIDAITEPKITYTFLADGVLLRE
ncbi:MAG: DUF4920 domain-containing protein [Aestuariibaculum sp.]